MATTPPPFPLRTPPTPLHGAKYTHPREGPLPSRKSRRIATEGKTTPRHRTPSPGPSASKQPVLRQSPRLLSKLEARNSVGAGSLLTPVKTPKKKEAAPTASTARVLFSSTKASSSKSNSSDLLQASTEVTNESITIFEDSNARIPRHDPSEDNPFGRSSQPSRKKRKPQTADVPEGEQPSANGMWTVFRGRKVWKDFRDPDKRETKIQPRLLFQEEVEEQNEEEDTDIESDPAPCPDDGDLGFEESVDKAKVGKVTRSRDLDAEEREAEQEVGEAEQTVEELRQKRVARFVDVEVVEPANNNNNNRLKTPEPTGPSQAGPMTPPSTVQKRKRPLEPDSAQKPMRSTGLFTPHRTPHRTPNKKRKLDEHASLRRAGRRTQV